MKRSAGAALLILVAGCAHVPTDEREALALDPLLAFVDPTRCELGGSHNRFLGSMVAGDANEGFRAGRVDVSQAYAPAFGEIYLRRYDHHTVVGVPIAGSLFGLPLVAIEQSFPEGGDPGETHYRFRENGDEVARVLTGRGFPVELGRSIAIGPPDGYEHFIELIADPIQSGHTLLTCGYR